MPGYNYPSYSKSLSYNHHYGNNYVKPQYPSINGPVCATYNGIWKTFANIYQFKDEINQGQAWNFHAYGVCPKPQKPLPEPIEPICAIYKNELRTFANMVALEVEKLITGKNWIKLFTGVCPYTPAPYTTTTPMPAPSEPCNNGPVCGILNGIWKTFINLKAFNKEVAKGLGWTFYGCGICPNPEVCARYKNEFRTFSSALALEVEKIVTGKKWVIVSSGVCAIRPTPTTTTLSPSTTTTPVTSTSTPQATVADEDFSISTETSTKKTTTEATTKPTTRTTPSTKYTSTKNPSITIDDDSFTLTTQSGCQTNHRIQQNNNYHGPYVEGSFHYNHNMFNQANIKPYHGKKY
ncbi:uncharacterized protein ACRADG_004828 [Cochliomyia hominivorax]